MMEEKKNVFDYISEIFATFGIITGIFMIKQLLVIMIKSFQQKTRLHFGKINFQ